MNGPWRDPGEETRDLYPGLVVHDNRVTGSITAGATRLPLWAFAGVAIVHGWAVAENSYDIEEYGLTREGFAEFIGDLLQQRGEFARLLLVLADVERRETLRKPWWDRKKQRARVADQLRRCIDVLEDGVS